MRRASFVFLLALAAGGCRKQSAATAASAAAATPAPAKPVELLPDIAGFAAGPITRDPSFLRRTYVRGHARITVTLAHSALERSQYQEWVRMSRAGFAQARLSASADEANGFYQCSADDADKCDLLIQTSGGAHLELRGDGTATRADVDALAAGLPLRALASLSTIAFDERSGTVSFARDIGPVLTNNCTHADGCHGAGATHKVQLDLRDGVAYATLVGRPSRMRSGASLVEPGHPARSFLVDKLTGYVQANEGQPMPLDPDSGIAVAQRSLDRFVWEKLVVWITQGAPNN